MAAIGLDTLLQTLGEVIHRTVDNILRYVVPGLRQTLFQCVDWLVGLWACLGLQDAPYAVVHDVQIGRIRWPLAVVSLWGDVDFDELRHVVADQVLSLFDLVRWGSVLHEHPVPLPIRPSGPWEDFASQKFSVTGSVDLHSLYIDRTFVTPCSSRNKSSSSVSHCDNFITKIVITVKMLSH